jgi:hypothetical protein
VHFQEVVLRRVGDTLALDEGGEYRSIRGIKMQALFQDSIPARCAARVDPMVALCYE